MFDYQAAAKAKLKKIQPKEGLVPQGGHGRKLFKPPATGVYYQDGVWRDSHTAKPVAYSKSEDSKTYHTPVPGQDLKKIKDQTIIQKYVDKGKHKR